jgi:hypothetical protein
VSFRLYEITEEVVIQAKHLGLFGDTKKRLQRAARRSVPYTSDLGNRRFLDFALTITDDVVVNIERIH